MRAKTLPNKSALIAAQYSAGMSMPKLAKLHCIELSTVCRVLEREGVPRRPRGRNTKAIEPVVCEAILRQYNGGMSTRAVARLHDISQASVIRAIHSMGGTLRPMGRPETTGEWRAQGKGKWSKRYAMQHSQLLEQS